MSDSATGGFLTPNALPAPLEDKDLDRAMQQLIVGVTGMSGENVRPRWQKEPPNEPPLGTDWAAVGVHDFEGDTYAVEQHNADGNGSSVIFRNERFDVLVSFYGDNARRNAAILREGLSLAQNREYLSALDMQLVSVGSMRPAPTMLNARWQYRIDVMFTVARAIRRVYPILNLLSASGEIVTDNDPQITVPINVPEE